MLTKVLLSFRDPEMKALYARANHSFFARVIILITVTLFLIALALQIVHATK